MPRQQDDVIKQENKRDVETKFSKTSKHGAWRVDTIGKVLSLAGIYLASLLILLSLVHGAVVTVGTGVSRIAAAVRFGTGFVVARTVQV